MIPQFGVTARPLAGWLQPGDKVALGRVIAVPPDGVGLALLAGAGKVGTPFNFNILDKETDKKFYCAQLIYWMYRSTSGVNLDTNDPLYKLYLTLVWGKWLGPVIASKSIGVDELWLGAQNIVIYSLGTVGVDSPAVISAASRRQ
jgi:hypothetical protein